MPGYHLIQIKKGVIGKTSKIREELEELEDAEMQGCRIMALMEASDLYGALRRWAEANGSTMDELRMMNDITRRAFDSGARK